MTQRVSLGAPQRPARTGEQPALQNRPTNTAVRGNNDRFETQRQAPVALNPQETPAQERDRRIADLHQKLEQVKNANPPMTEAQIDQLLGSAGDNRYEITGTKLDKETQQGLLKMMGMIHQIGRAKLAASEGRMDEARALLDMDPAEQYEGTTVYRDKALSHGITHAEMAPLTRAAVDLTAQTFGALSADQEKLHEVAGNSLQLGREVTDYFNSKNEVMSQGGFTQATLKYVEKYTGELEQAMALPLTDHTRTDKIKAAQTKLDEHLKNLGADPVKRLEANRRGTIDGLNNIADMVSQVPTPVTRGAGLLLRTTANGLEYASGDIDGKQFALKEAAAIIDAAGGQLSQRLRGAGKFVLDQGAEFTKTLSAELAKIDPKLPQGEKDRLVESAVKTALLSTVNNVFNDMIGASFGEAGETIKAELAKAVASGLNGLVGQSMNEYRKIMNDPSLTPEQRSAAVKEVLWKGLQNVVKSASEGVLGAAKR